MTRSSPELIPEETLDRAVEILKAVASPIRLQIVNILMSGECQVLEIYKAMGIKQSLASLQLNILKFAGIVKSRRDWYKVYYSLANDSIKKIMESIIADI